VTVEMDVKRPTFHSLRKNFATSLIVAGVDTNHAVLLMGHSPADKTFNIHYLKMTSSQKANLLLPAIEKLNFPALARMKP
jgi:integrase